MGNFFESVDGTRLAYHRTGTGDPLICLPGGPMQSSAYLGDLRGLSAHRELVLLDPRGTGDSATPDDPATYRCDRQVADVEALRTHLGLDRVDLLAHSAGAATGVLYAARHPDRVHRLVLVTPTPRAVGMEITDADRREIAELRRDEPWFGEAFAAFERIWGGEYTEANFTAIAPFSYGRWSPEMEARMSENRNDAAAAEYYAEGALDPLPAVADLPVRVLVVAGGYDVGLPPKRAADYAHLFPEAELTIQPAAGHFPWLDDPRLFVSTVAGFLR